MFISMRRSAQLSALVLFGLVGGQAGAADDPMYGIGAGASGGGASIYFPIRTGSLIVEPHISYFHSKDTTDGAGTDTHHYPPSMQVPDDAVPITLQRKNLNERLEIGLGLFSKHQIADELDLYYGGRFGYLANKGRSQQKSEYLSCCSGAYINRQTYETDRKQTGYFLAPTVGLQYFPRPNFSLGIEVSLRYSNLSGHESDTQSQTTTDPSGYFSSRTTSGNSDSVGYTTLTAAIIRGYF